MGGVRETKGKVEEAKRGRAVRGDRGNRRKGEGQLVRVDTYDREGREGDIGDQVCSADAAAGSPCS